MNKTQTMWRTVLILVGSLALLAAIYLCYRYYMGQEEHLPILLVSMLGFSCFSCAKRYTPGYQEQVSLKQLIYRTQNMITFKGKPESGCVLEKGIELAAERLSILTIRDDYLSAIIDGNGNGWDFFVFGSAGEIEAHLRSLLSVDEQALITFKPV